MNAADYNEFKYLVHGPKCGGTLDTLIALVERGPLDDGDIPSKSGRSELVELGFAAQVLVNGEDGYNAATYWGRELYCYHYGKSDTIKEAKAYRLMKRAIRDSQ